MNFPAECRRPIDKAMYLVEQAAAATKNKTVMAYVASAATTRFSKEEKGPHTDIQTRLVITGFEDIPIETLFLYTNTQKVINRLRELGVSVSTNAEDCKQARVVKQKVNPPKVKVPSIWPEGTKLFEKKKDMAKPKKRGRPKKVKNALDFEMDKIKKKRKARKKDVGKKKKETEEGKE